MAPKICIKTHEDLCLKVTPKTGLHDLCGRKFAGKSCTKNFPGKFGEIQQNPSHSKNLPAPTPTIWWKGTSAPLPHFERAEGDALAMPSFSGVPVQSILHALKCVTEMKINYQRPPKTEQFMTAKISGNALKQGSRTHSVLRQRSSQLQKYKAARMSRRVAIDQKICGWDGEHPRLTVWNLLNYTRIENAHEVRKKIFVFVMWLLYVQLIRGKKDTDLCKPLCSILLKCQLMTKLERKHLLQAQVCDCISTKKRNEKLAMQHEIK